MASAALTCTGRGGNTPVIQAHTPFCCNKNKGQAATKCRYHPTTASSEINHKNKALGASSQLRVSQCFCDKLWATSAMLTARGSIFLCRTGWRELLTHSGRASNTPDCLNLTIKKEHTDISRTWALEGEAAPLEGVRSCSLWLQTSCKLRCFYKKWNDSCCVQLCPHMSSADGQGLCTGLNLLPNSNRFPWWMCILPSPLAR